MTSTTDLPADDGALEQMLRERRVEVDLTEAQADAATRIAEQRFLDKQKRKP